VPTLPLNNQRAPWYDHGPGFLEGRWFAVWDAGRPTTRSNFSGYSQSPRPSTCARGSSPAPVAAWSANVTIAQAADVRERPSAARGSEFQRAMRLNNAGSRPWAPSPTPSWPAPARDTKKIERPGAGQNYLRRRDRERTRFTGGLPSLRRRHGANMGNDTNPWDARRTTSRGRKDTNVPSIRRMTGTTSSGNLGNRHLLTRATVPDPGPRGGQGPERQSERGAGDDLSGPADRGQ